MENLSSIIENDVWAIAEGTHKDLPLLVRFREKLVPGIDVSNHPQLIRIYWEYEAHTSGMPSEADSDEMEVFENRLVDALENDLAGVLAAVVTTNGYREWIYYINSVDTFASRLHNMPQEQVPYPITIETEADPEWDYYFNRVRPE